jgi:hypothetical protein
MISRRLPPKAALYVDNELVHLEKASLLVASGLAGVATAALAGFVLAGFDSFLSILLPCLFLGWMLSVVVVLED